MNADQAIDAIRQALTVGLMVAAPVLSAGLLIGLAVSIFQAVTQIQEQTLSFIPKIFAMAIVAIAVVPWGAMQIMTFAEKMFAP